MVVGLQNDFVPIPACEGIREGVDDISYISALERMAQNSPLKAEVEKFLEGVQKEVLEVIPPAPGDERPDVREFNLRGFPEPERWRKSIIEMILKLKGGE